MDRFDECLPFILAREGGKVDDPTDRGGRTAYGVTQRAYDAYMRSKGRTSTDVWLITPSEVADVYRSGYWIPTRCGELPKGLDLAVFDAAVQHGTKRAIVFLQRALCITEDGQFGPKTLEAVQDDVANDVVAYLIKSYIRIRDEFYDAIVAHDPAQSKFRKGWANRMAALSNETGVA